VANGRVRGRATGDSRAGTSITMSNIHATIDAVWRIESAKLIAGLARIVRDVGVAEDLAQDALVAALEQWPESGVPDKPGAWLMAAAKHRAIDGFRRSASLERKHEELARELESRLEPPDLASAIANKVDDEVGDDLLRLVFTACHPVLSTEARVTLTLRLLGGLPPSTAPLPSAHSARTASRPPSPPATPAPAPPPRPTGRASQLSTTPCRNSPPPRSWS